MDKPITKRIASVLIGIAYTTFGILMITNPATTLKALSLIAGIIILITGFAYLFLNKENSDKQDSTMRMIEAILLMLLGLMFLFGNHLNNMLLLSYLLLFWIIIDSMLQLNFSLHREKSPYRTINIVIDLIIVASSIYVLFNPLLAEMTLVIFVGFTFIGTGATKVIKEM
ncbi:DUF308 domain-containing protein [Erysipelothrix urinaevulpis]|uniref:DUF308 domain-containing protein n=1 Tax=Erysipelothrix urinaevulpis TaxID=2683717 RepID=UPI00135983D1|nr:DUF308 domain-containing protein [Erysipelothrix urinaevulpis]